MSLQNNRLDLVLTDAQVDDLRTHFSKINDILNPFAQALTIDERSTIPKMNVSNKAFVSDAMVAVKGNAEFLPAYLTADAMDKDYKLFEQLEEFLAVAASISEKLSDTQMLAGSEAYQSALAAYRLFGAAAKAGLNGADSVYGRLSERFAEQGPRGATVPVVATA